CLASCGRRRRSKGGRRGAPTGGGAKRGSTLLAVAGSGAGTAGTASARALRFFFLCLSEAHWQSLRFERFARHFLVSSMEWSREKVMEVYHSIMLQRLQMMGFSTARSLSRIYTGAVLEVYDFAKSSFKRSPLSPYLTWTVRDVAKTFQGILKALDGGADPGGAGAAAGADQEAKAEALLLETFLHEVARVFEDKLKLQLQKDLLHQELRRLRSSRKMPESGAPRRFLKRLSASIAKPYERVEEEQLRRCFQESLEEYRQLKAGEAASTSFFLSEEVVDQLCRLLRTGALVRGHMLLLGLLGSGRRSLCGLAAHLLDAVYFETKEAVTEKEFLQMLRVVWRTCGAKQSDCILVLADEDLRDDGVLDSISAVLDLGHIPELCSPDEITNMPALDFKDSLSGVHQHLHLVLCLSPMDFRILRKFPKLLCCCAVSHVEAWRVDSWQAMAEQRLSETLDIDVASRLARCLARSQELNPATATVRSFSQVLQNFTQLWRLKSAQVAKKRGRLERALQVLAKAPSVHAELQRKVSALQAEVEEQEAKLTQLREVAASIAADVQSAQEQLREAEVFAEAQESACKTLQAEVQGAMDEVAQPYRTAVKAFEKAEKKLSSSRAESRKEVSELKSFANPPPLILAIMEMVAMLFGCSVEWSAAKTLISETSFGKRFRDFDKDHLSDALSARLKAEVSRADFNPTLVESQSKAAKFICNWLRALAAYDEVYRSTAGLRERASQTESEAEAARRDLAIKQAELKSLEEKAMEPAKMLEEAQSQMETLMNELDAGLKRAGLVSQVLHGGLFAEEGSWEKQLAALTRSSESLPGECLFAAVCLAYLGPVAPAQRPLWEESLKSLWAERPGEQRESKKASQYDFNFSDPVHHQWEVESVRSLDDADVDPSGSNVDSASEHGAQEDGSSWTLPSFLFDEVSEQEWNAQGLPAALAVSAALALKVPSMPLCLDPHEQACRWLRKVIPSLTVTHAASPKLSQALTACRQEGKPLLVLGCRAVLAPSLLQYLSEESEAKCEDLSPGPLPRRAKAGAGPGPGPDPAMAVEETQEAPGAQGQGGPGHAAPQEELEAEEGAFSQDCEFRLYLLTADKEMELPSRVQFKIATINFTADQSSLDDFFLLRLSQQGPQGEATELLSFVQNQREFLMLEDQLLSQLTEMDSGGELFEEEVALAAVATSFGRVQELREALGEAVQTLQAQLEKTRSIYGDLAEHCARLFQSLDGLATCLGGAAFLCSLVDIGESASAACQALLKQQSLVAFGQDTLLSTAASMMVLTSSSLWAVASRVLRRFAWSFFRHQLPLLLIHTALLLEPQEPALLDFLLGGKGAAERAERHSSATSSSPSSSPDLGLWPRPAWRSICALAELQPTFRDLPTHIQENLDSWRKALDMLELSSTASSCSHYPAPFNELSDGFSRVLLVSALQPALASRELLLYALEVLRGDEDEGMAVEVSGPVELEEALSSALLLSDQRNRGGSGGGGGGSSRSAEEVGDARISPRMFFALEPSLELRSLPLPQTLRLRTRSEERSAAQSSASRKMSFRKKPADALETSASKSPRKKSIVDGQLESSASISSRVSKSSGLERKKSMADQGDSGSPRSPSMGKKLERNRSMVDRSGTNTLSRTGSMAAMSSPVRRILEPCSSPEPAQLDGFARIHDTAADDRGTGDGAKGCWRAHDADDRRARGFSGPGRREVLAGAAAAVVSQEAGQPGREPWSGSSDRGRRALQGILGPCGWAVRQPPEGPPRSSRQHRKGTEGEAQDLEHGAVRQSTGTGRHPHLPRRLPP
ncbi:DNAH2, partial [Symbiodinium necroappetens]